MDHFVAIQKATNQFAVHKETTAHHNIIITESQYSEKSKLFH